MGTCPRSKQSSSSLCTNWLRVSCSQANPESPTQNHWAIMWQETTQLTVAKIAHHSVHKEEAFVENLFTFFFFFLREFQPMMSTLNNSSLSSNQDTNKFFGVCGD